MFQHILIPLDGSDVAEQALHTAQQIARQTGATLHLIQIVTSPTDMIWYSPAGPGIIALDAIETEIKHATGYLREQAKKLEGIPVVIHVESGDTVDSILNYIKEKSIELLLMTSHGRSRVKRWFMGNIAQRLVRRCPVPSFVLHEHRGGYKLPEQLQIMVALDGSKAAEAAIRPASALLKALTKPEAGLLHLVQVIQTFTYIGLEEYEQQALERVRNYLNEVQQRVLAESGSSIRVAASPVTTTETDVASVLLDLLNNGLQEFLPDMPSSEQYDIIAMTTHGRTGLERMIMGSVAERILVGSQTPLLITHPTQIKPTSPETV